MYRGFSIDVIHSNWFTYVWFSYKRSTIKDELKIGNSIAFAHSEARIFSDSTCSRETQFLVAPKPFPHLNFSTNLIPSDAASSRKPTVMERPKMYVSPDEVYRVSHRQLLRVVTSERSNSGTTTWIEMLASKTRSSGKSWCRRSCQGKTVWQRLNVKLSYL